MSSTPASFSTAQRMPLVSGTFAATVTSTGLIAQQVAGKAVRDAIFLSSFKAQHLPHAMALGATLSLIAAACMPKVAARISPRRLMPVLFSISAVGFVLDWLVFRGFPHLGSLAVYLQTTVLAPVAMATFWSLVNERFDPHTAKTAVARIAAGGTLGGVLGGLAAWRAASLVSFGQALLLLSVLNVLCLASVLVIRTPPLESAHPAAPASTANPDASPLQVMREAPFLRHLALLVALGALLSALLDYVFGAQAVAHYGRGPRLLQFFSLFGVAVSVLSLLLQVSLGRIAMQKLGLTVNIAVLPGIIVFGSALGLAVPGLASAALLRGTEMIQRNTLFKSAYELLYTPLPEIQKRTTKALIDVGFDRLGTLIGSLFAMLVVHTVTSNQSTLLAATVVFAFCTVPVVRRLHVGYVEALESRLREGQQRLGELEGAAPPSVDGDRARELLIDHAASIAAKPGADGGPAAETLAAPGRLVELTTDLLSGDLARTREALRQVDPSTVAVAGPVLLLLAHKELHLEAREALRRVAPRILGQLVDALLDREMDFVVRRRIPPVLAVCRDQRAADGLLLALADERFEVRYAAGRALMRMTDDASEIVLAEDKVVKLILAEVEREQEVASEIDDEHLSGEAMAPLDIVIRDRVSRGLEHLFTMLALLLDREALRMAFRALHQEDARYRGTALEYLQTVLPAELRDVIWPLISESGPLPTPRLPSEVLGDLTRFIRLERMADAPKSVHASTSSPSTFFSGQTRPCCSQHR